MKQGLILITFFTILLSGCYWFETIEQPLDAFRDSMISTSITATCAQGGGRHPYFGICLPSGWSVVGDCIQCTGVYNGVIDYVQDLSEEQESVSPAPAGYYWWVGSGPEASTPEGYVNADLEILTDDQLGTFFIDYMLGDDGNGVNRQRSDDHPISIIDEFTPCGLQASDEDDYINLRWKEPLQTDDLIGYYLYLDESLINMEIITDTTFIDMEPLPGIHHYSVSSLYDDGSEHLNPAELPVIFGEELYVSPSGNNTNSGSSWEEALLTISHTLTAISPDSLHPLTINLAAGTYSPDTGESFPLCLKSHVSLTGSGELYTFLDADSQNTVIRIYDKTDVSISFLTIENGHSPAFSDGGCGIYCSWSNPHLMNVTINNNACFGTNGAGIALYNSSPVLEYVSIFNNSCESGIAGFPAYGGGIFCDNNCFPEFLNVNISNNTAEQGGGIFCSQNSNLSLFNVLIDNNNAGLGAGLCLIISQIEAVNCIISNNSAWSGGGIYCNETSYLELTDVIISGNTASSTGGGIYCSGNCSALLTNVTLSDNIAMNPDVTNYGGGIYLWESQLDLLNSLITGNNGLCGCGIYSFISSININNSIIADNNVDYSLEVLRLISCNVTMSNCILWNDEIEEFYFGNSLVNIIYSDIRGGWQGEGNIDLDPLFTGSGDHPYSLLPESPCIDTGTPDTTGLQLPPWDILGNCRIWDGDGDGIARIDMGAYEYDAPPYTDVNEPTIPNSSSLISHLSNFPNPFNPSTIISYQLPAGSEAAELTIYNLKGQKIKSLECHPSGAGHSPELDGGRHSVLWNGTDANNQPVASGIYLYRLKTERDSQVRKMILLK